MGKDKRRIVSVGCGTVGMSYAYAMLSQQTYNELVLTDYIREKAEGGAMNSSHGLVLSGSYMKIWGDTYVDYKEADIVTIYAGVAWKPDESHMDSLARDTATFKLIVEPVMNFDFNGVFLITTNLVGVMTKTTCDLSGLNPKCVVGSGTSLGTVRLRYLVGSYFKVDPHSIRGYVMGEHDDSEFVLWSQVCTATKPMLDAIAELSGIHGRGELKKIGADVRMTADKITAAEKAIYYGIGIALTRLTRTMLGGESSVQTVSAYLRDEYKQNDVFTGVPAVINTSNAQPVIYCQVTDKEQEKFDTSCRELKDRTAEAKRDLGH